MLKKLFILLVLITPQILFSQELDNSYTVSDYENAMKALIVTFFFQGSMLVMALYMLLMYVQYQKKDYFYYGVYLSLFFIYFYMRIETIFHFNIFTSNPDLYYYIKLPIMFVTLGVYIKFISVFADIESFNKNFNKQIIYFSYFLYATALTTFLITVFTGDNKIIENSKSFIMLPIHLFSLYAIIRAFIVVKSKLRYYVLISNMFLFVFSMFGAYIALKYTYKESMSFPYLLGFYSFNSSQLGTFLEMVGFSLGLGYKYSLIEKEKNEAVEMSALKAKLYADISHEFRTPLTLISGPIDSILSTNEFTETELENFAMIKRNTNRLSSLVNQLLDLAKLDAGNFKLHPLKGNLSLFLSTIVKSFEFEARKKEISFNVNISPIQNSWYDEDVIEKIATNLLSNALKYCPKNGICNFEVKKQDETIFINISNTTNNLNQDELTNLFDRYYQKDEFAEGTGIGLSLVNELVKLCDGKISVNLEDDQLIHFIIQLPLLYETFNTKQDLKKVNENLSSIEIIKTEEELIKEKEFKINRKNELPILLIVEDHVEVRQFIKQSFQHKYQIFEVENGKEGIEKAIEIIPDIILSDVRMPICNGIELCNTLKTNILTSHIPIILLTAGIGEENTLIGLKSGADEFIEKPFKFRILDAKISNLIEVRKRIRKKFQQDFLLKTSEIGYEPTEEIFLNKIQEILDNELSNPDFNAINFAKKMNISRMQLHRKLNTYTGLSTTAFIRSQRLKQAIHLLKNSKIAISEVAYLVGFNTPSYFIKCFKDSYQMTPSEFIDSL